MYKNLFQHFMDADKQRLHFAAHSHHPWPDCSFDAQKQYWEDSAAYADLKWGKVIFSSIVPRLQGHIATTLSLSKPQNIAFAPNTHEFVNRLISCLPQQPRILTSDSEFYSFQRQAQRLEEDETIHVRRVPAPPFTDFTERFISAIKGAEKPYDMIFLSQVFFNSGFAVQDLKDIIETAAEMSDETLIIIDGYHGFMALPTDLSPFEDRIFYMSGGYKYAMAGEGCCFMHCPDSFAMRPPNTGWFAEIGALGQKRPDLVPYAEDGFRFWGATFDPSGLYRMLYVFDMLEEERIGIRDIHNHVMTLQDYAIERLDALNHPDLQERKLLVPNGSQRGHFLTYKTENAGDLKSQLENHNIITDYRDDRLRFGFGLYQDKAMIDALHDRLKEIL